MFKALGVESKVEKERNQKPERNFGDRYAGAESLFSPYLCRVYEALIEKCGT